MILFTGVDAVNLPAPKLHLIPAWYEVAFFHLFCQRPNRPSDQTLNAPDHVLVSGGTKEHGVAVVDHTFLHTLRDQFFPLLRRHFRPEQLLTIRLSGKPF